MPITQLFRTDRGRIVTIGSNVGERVPMPGLTFYAMTKSALLSFTAVSRATLGPVASRWCSPGRSTPT